MNFRNGKDYFEHIKKMILEDERSMEEADRLEPALLEIWLEKMKEKALVNWTEYKSGIRYDHRFTPQEYNDLWENSTYEYASNILNGLVDKNLVEVSVREDGELLYGLTKLGREIADQYTKNKNEEDDKRETL
jgi:hypothetical protein